MHCAGDERREWGYGASFVVSYFVLFNFLLDFSVKISHYDRLYQSSVLSC